MIWGIDSVLEKDAEKECDSLGFQKEANRCIQFILSFLYLCFWFMCHYYCCFNHWYLYALIFRKFNIFLIINLSSNYWQFVFLAFCVYHLIFVTCVSVCFRYVIFPLSHSLQTLFRTDTACLRSKSAPELRAVEIYLEFIPSSFDSPVVLSVHPSIHLSNHPSIHPSIHGSIDSSIIFTIYCTNLCLNYVRE